MPADNEIIARLVPEQGVRAELNTYYLYDKIDPQTVIDALGYVPYNATNPAGYEANTIDSISVNGVEQQITNKNVDITVQDSLPPQTDNAGKFLTTNGTTTSWASLATVATTGSYTDLINKPTIPDTTNMQVTTNLVTSVSSASTDVQYPSAKLFYDTCGDIETLINAL